MKEVAGMYYSDPDENSDNIWNLEPDGSCYIQYIAPNFQPLTDFSLGILAGSCQWEVVDVQGDIVTFDIPFAVYFRDPEQFLGVDTCVEACYTIGFIRGTIDRTNGSMLFDEWVTLADQNFNPIPTPFTPPSGQLWDFIQDDYKLQRVTSSDIRAIMEGIGTPLPPVLNDNDDSSSDDSSS